MKIQLLPSNFGSTPLQYATSLLIDEHLAIDAGSLGYWSTPDDQARVRNVLISHTHADHLASLPIFVENVYRAEPEPVHIWGNEQVCQCIHEDIFNGRIWPDFFELSPPDAPFLKLSTLVAEKPLVIRDLTITPVLLKHAVRTFGFIIEWPGGSIAIASDSGPTDRLWELCHGLKNLKAIITEVAFPNSMTELAEIALHNTSQMLAGEVAKMPTGIPIFASHLKAQHHEEVVSEVQALGIDRLQIFEPGRDYEF